MTISKCQIKQANEIWQKHTDDEIDEVSVGYYDYEGDGYIFAIGDGAHMWGQEFADWAEAEIGPHRPDLSIVTLPIPTEGPIYTDKKEMAVVTGVDFLCVETPGTCSVCDV